MGTGGVGKTRLALRVADEVADSYPDGVWVVELASVRSPQAVAHASPQAVAHAVATVLGVLQLSGRSIDDALAEFLRSRRLLLVVDNCEHVLGAAAVLVERLLRRCPRLTVLATSRELLAIDGEQAWPVPPLPVPARTAREPRAVLEAAAVALFTDRARAARPDFSLDEDAAPAVAEICRGLDGLPLAIELAAARVPALIVGDLAEHLGQRFTVLTAVRRTETERHRTLRAVVDWSYGLLEEPQRRVFERLSVFSGGWTMRDAAAVCSVDDPPAQQMVEIVASLAEKSMVVTPSPGGPSRYVLLGPCGSTGPSDCRPAATASGWDGPTPSTSWPLPSRPTWDCGAPTRARGCSDWAPTWTTCGPPTPGAVIGEWPTWPCGSRRPCTGSPAGRTTPRSSRGRRRRPRCRLPATILCCRRSLGSAGLAAWRRGDLAGAVEYAERGLAASAGVDDPSRALPLEVLADVHSFSGRLDDAFEAYAEAARLG
ncbi:MAG: hypothetical protein M3N52_02320, partial [Actinomycetota bacterium]|nr:hypothetical protein [Actinomycetota bacterium]